MEIDKCVSYADEAQLLGYGESDSFGPWIKLRLIDHTALENFRSQPKGAKLGKRYMIALSEIGDDEQPVPAPTNVEIKKERSEAQKAAIMLNHPNFIKFAKSQGWDDADKFLKSYCGITSKKELNDPFLGVERKYQMLLKEYSSYTANRVYTQGI